MEKFMKFLDEKISEPMAIMADQKHLRAVRDGIVATLPIIIVGSFFLILAFPPLPETNIFAIWAKANAGTILLPYRMTMFIMSLYASWGIGYSLARSYKLDGVSGANISAVAFLLTQTPIVSDELGFVLPMKDLGGSGLFVAMIVSLFSVEIMRLVLKSRFKISMPEGVPSSVARSFENLVPMAMVVVIMSLITYWIKFEWYVFITNILEPVVGASDTLPGVIIPVFLIAFFWFGGIHGVSIIGSLLRPIWITMIDANADAFSNGVALPFIAPEPFYQWFIWIGGAGSTIGLAILLATMSKSAYAKTLGRTCVLPSIFNINEPLIFGAPIVLNPILIIPFIGAPILNAIVSYIVTSLGLVDRVIMTAPWTLPGPIGAFIATGGDWRAIILNLALILLSIIVYYPFFKVYDKKQLESEKSVV
jgi:cellobiose PTS system EIIC component